MKMKELTMVDLSVSVYTNHRLGIFIITTGKLIIAIAIATSTYHYHTNVDPLFIVSSMSTIYIPYCDSYCTTSI